MFWNVDHRIDRSSQARPAEARNAKSVFLSTLFVEFPGNATNFVGSAGLTLFEEFPGNATNNLQKKIWNGAQKKVPESAGLVRDDLAVL